MGGPGAAAGRVARAGQGASAPHTVLPCTGAPRGFSASSPRQDFCTHRQIKCLSAPCRLLQQQRSESHRLLCFPALPGCVLHLCSPADARKVWRFEHQYHSSCNFIVWYLPYIKTTLIIASSSKVPFWRQKKSVRDFMAWSHCGPMNGLVRARAGFDVTSQTPDSIKSTENTRPKFLSLHLPRRQLH